MMRLSLSVLFLLLINFSHAFADCTNVAHGQRLIDESDIVFEGIATKTTHSLVKELTLSPTNYSTEFNITAKYKGDISDVIKILYNHSENVAPTIGLLEPGVSYLVFARKHKDGYYYLAPCQTQVMRFDRFNLDELRKRGLPQQTVDTLEAVSKQPNFKNENIKNILEAGSGHEQKIRALLNQGLSPN